MRRLFIGIALLCTLSACEDEMAVPVVTVQSSSQTKAKQGAADRTSLEITEGNWKPAQNWVKHNTSRNPFRGFSDAVLAEKVNEENRKAQEAAEGVVVTLPAQMYNAKDYRLIASITGTADPKAFVVDPSGKRFVLRRGDLIGNNNGTISSIQREKVEVFEMVSGEGKYIELQLYPDGDKGITFKLQ